ncbi:hypothetical protein CA13_40810 [Planctomycetes bacterium CA13]|uniref:Uncharacterized protein n=2 Tax=Novipirellula herctigrandis TaxID=2527986 RepID=A0A5C5Z5N7_9BACT|nr:hypothetical protein CA13_40810 [Planctomycetes bacterium CA13]
MGGVCFLIEIHPLGHSSFHPLRQAAPWYGFVEEAEICELQDGDCKGLRKAIELIEARATQRDLRLVIRDWANLDWIGFPFVEKPPLRSSWDDLCVTSNDSGKRDWNVPRVATVCHPLGQYLRCKDLDALKPSWNDEVFWRGTRLFAEAIQQMCWFRFEDFLAAPKTILRELCAALVIPYDPAWQQQWNSYTNITGEEVCVKRGGIEPSERRPVTQETWNRLRDNDDFYVTLELLGYPLPEPMRRWQTQSILLVGRIDKFSDVAQQGLGWRSGALAAGGPARSGRYGSTTPTGRSVAMDRTGR